MRDNAIIIQPVANGFVVYLPEVHKGDEFQKIGNMIVGISQKLNENELMGKTITDAEPEATERQFNRDKNCHVFKTFTEALAFLTVTFE